MPPAVPYIVAAGAAIGAGAAVHQASTARKQRKQMARDAALERDALAALQAQEPEVIPTANSDDARRARRRSIASMARRRGRSSTILTGDSSGTLGA